MEHLQSAVLEPQPQLVALEDETGLARKTLTIDGIRPSRARPRQRTDPATGQPAFQEPLRYSVIAMSVFARSAARIAGQVFSQRRSVFQE